MCIAALSWRGDFKGYLVGIACFKVTGVDLFDAFKGHNGRLVFGCYDSGPVGIVLNEGEHQLSLLNGKRNEHTGKGQLYSFPSEQLGRLYGGVIPLPYGRGFCYLWK
ncbi:MAG: hypothetical protein LBK65_10170 [Tannerellaceae bacterium]|nr:hypothetical protein [Tannerellaceae bacterium]